MLMNYIKMTKEILDIMEKNPNNYVSFNNELWRIIGITQI